MKWPIALTIAGSDSGGGAGIQADIKTFSSLQVHGTSVITCITAQNPREVRAVQPIKSTIVLSQLEAIYAELKPAVAKTGMLYSSAIINTVAGFLAHSKTRLILDPVMVAGSGAVLLQKTAIRTLQEKLFPLATLITPNIPEAELILKRKLNSLDQVRAAAADLQRRFGCAVLVKGGHLKGSDAGVDVFFDGKSEELLSDTFIPNVTTHGTGCTFSAAITAYVALEKPLAEAVTRGKNYITSAIKTSHLAGSHNVLNTRFHLV